MVRKIFDCCFRGDTRVALVDGLALSFEEMFHLSEQGEYFWGYSIGPYGRIFVTLLENPRHLGRCPLLEVSLDNETAVFCALDHLFMLRDGRMVSASNLKPNDSLMPLYRHIARGYEMVYQPLNGHLYPTHRLSDEWNLRHSIYVEEPNTHRHHIDHNRLNNNPWNVIRINASEHIRLHNDLNYGPDFDPSEHSASIKQTLATLKQDPVWNEMFSRKQRERALKFWHDPQYQQKRQELLEQRQTCSDETRLAHRESMLRYYQSQQARDLTSQLSKQAWARDDGSRKAKQAHIMRTVVNAEKMRHEITADVVREALDQAGSIRGAARLLNCDRSVFRRFPEVIQAFRGQTPKNHKVVSVREAADAYDVYGLTVPEAGNFALEAGVFVCDCQVSTNA